MMENYYPRKTKYNDDNDYDDTDNNDFEQSEMKNEDNINLIVHAALEELQSKR